MVAGAVDGCMTIAMMMHVVNSMGSMNSVVGGLQMMVVMSSVMWGLQVMVMGRAMDEMVRLGQVVMMMGFRQVMVRLQVMMGAMFVVMGLRLKVMSSMMMVSYSLRFMMKGTTTAAGRAMDTAGRGAIP